MDEYRIFKFGGMEYKVYKNGDIYGKRGKLKQRLNADGYYDVTVGYKNHRTSRKVHRIVMMAWKPLDDYEGMEVNHIDYDRTNNSLDNLEWMTHKENVEYSKHKYGKTFKGSTNPKAHFTEQQVIDIRLMYEDGWTIPQIVYELYGVTHSNNHSEYVRVHGWISDIVKYRTWKHIA